MKKIIAIILSLIAVVSLAACDKAPEATTPKDTPAETPAESTPVSTPEETPTETPVETEPGRPDLSNEEIVLVENGEQKTYIVVPKGKLTNELYAKDKLTLIVENKTGLKMNFGTNVTDSFEILIGDTGREESAALKATLTGDQYGIKIENGQVILAATEDAFLYDAMAYFVENYLTITDTKIAVNTKKASYVGEGDTASYRYIFSKAEDKEITFRAEGSFKLHVSVPNAQINASQGGCTDGTYFYQAFIQRVHTPGTADEMYNRVVIIKYDKDGKVIKQSEVFGGTGTTNSLKHANDLTYNPNTNEIYVSHVGNKTTILDADTLELKRSFNSGVAYYGITYSPERDAVAVAGGGKITLLNSEMNKTKGSSFSFSSKTKGYTSQGICSDETFIYCLYINETTHRNYIAVYDWRGNYICLIDTGISYTSGTYNNEGENIGIYDGKLCMTVCSGIGVGARTYSLIPK